MSNNELELYEKIDAKLDKVHEGLYLINSRLVAIETDLRYHIARTDQLESQMVILDKDITKVKGFFMYAGWILGGIATVSAILVQAGLLP